MADENVRPTFNPRKTLDAVKMTVIRAPSRTPRNVSSGNVTSAGTRMGWVMEFSLSGSREF
ncbi:hypothetical protein D3C72_2394950 [compost metagenome]